MATTEATLAALLSETFAAHATYETSELGGVYDQQWPAWYTRYLVEHGIGALLGRAVTSEEVAALLAECDETYRRDNPATTWPDFYARQFLARAARCARHSRASPGAGVSRPGSTPSIPPAAGPTTWLRPVEPQQERRSRGQEHQDHRHLRQPPGSRGLRGRLSRPTRAGEAALRPPEAGVLEGLAQGRWQPNQSVSPDRPVLSPTTTRPARP
jgi:hypothetical protein